MKPEITNIHNLPMEVFNAIVKDRYTVDGEAPSDYSASKLSSPIQMIELAKRFPDKLIQRDVTHFFFSFIGSIAHAVLEEAWQADTGSKIEERLYMDVQGKVLSGKFDNYLAPQIRDYKCTKAYKIMRGDYSDWEQQQNVYAQLCIEKGYPVESLKIICFILDFKKHEMFKDKYPKCPIVTIDLDLWPEEKRIAFINERISCFIEAENTPDDELHKKFPCSNKEMWKDIKDHAIVKKGASRATKVFHADNKADGVEYHAEKYSDKPEYEFVTRYSDRKRCLEWCDSAAICQQNKDLHEAEGREWPHVKPLF